MALRFQCAACSQPIEIDDEWSGKAVICPYCRKSVTAPSESTLEEAHALPVAAPLESPHGITDPNDAPAQPVPHSRKNTLALVAFIAAMASILMIVAWAFLLSAHQPVVEELFKPERSVSEQMDVFTEYIDSQGGSPPIWLILAMMLPFAFIGASLVALVCGLIALRKPTRRPLAIAGIIIGGIPILFLCAGRL